jgi:lambda family phage holin
MKMHNDPHSWTEFIELLHSWWRGETPMGAVLLSVAMAALRIAYGGGGWKKMKEPSVGSDPYRCVSS